jgi:hypothetical protein
LTAPPSSADDARIVQLALFSLRDFRCLVAFNILNSAGMMGESVVLGWLTLELTNSPFLVGVAMGARALPLFFVGVPAGVLADRVPRHRLLVAVSIGQAATASTLGALAVFGVVELSHILTLTFAAGVLRGIEHAARQSYAHDVAGPGALVGAFAILGVAMRAGWLVGSLGVGSVIAHQGAGVAYFAVAACFLAGGVAMLVATPLATAAAHASGSAWQSLLGFFTALRQEPVLAALIVMTASAEIFGFAHQTVLPSLARDVLHVGPEGLGAMNAARAIGGIVGLAAIWRWQPARGNGALFLVVLATFGAGLVVLAFAPKFVGLAGVLLVIVLVNAIGALADLLAQSLLQLSVPPELRGRAGGAWVLAIGLAPLGQLQIGALASLFTVSLALGTSGFALIAIAGVFAVASPRIRRL